MTTEDLLKNDIENFLLELNTLAVKVRLQEKCEMLGLYSEYSKFVGEVMRLRIAVLESVMDRG